MTGKKADWGARYETMADCMGVIQSVADSLMSDYPNPYPVDKGAELIDDLADIYIDAVNNYDWPESPIWEKWSHYVEWYEHDLYKEVNE